MKQTHELEGGSERRPPSRQEKAAGAKEHRCHCGQLMAVWTPAGIELKCRRCKRIEVIPVQNLKQPR